MELRDKKKAKILKRFENKSRWKTIRKLYFRKRDQQRLDELDELERDVDYLLAELRRLERRTREPNLIPFPLVALAVQLSYLMHRKEYPSDKAIRMKLADEFCCCEARIIYMIYGKSFETSPIPNSWWINQEKGGEEIDFHIPQECKAEIPKFPFGKHGRLKQYRKEQLIDLIKYLSKRLMRIEKIHYTIGSIPRAEEKEYRKEMEEFNLGGLE